MKRSFDPTWIDTDGRIDVKLVNAPLPITPAPTCLDFGDNGIVCWRDNRRVFVPYHRVDTIHQADPAPAEPSAEVKL